ncbi:hypothetical protein QBC38DRAFT_518144 [Podospora fimiseda]|uniref:Uncharacterized protein n=1 Tax=Podospora fimiseda TaxID=252190 RepID=A0AAN7BGT1_9PEZI|nr:hypothetical protein QBC38DRAFT_518144 [Podospora fimiseda]
MATPTYPTSSTLTGYVTLPLTTTFDPPENCKYNNVPTKPGSYGELVVNDVVTYYWNSYRSVMPPAYSCYPPSFPSAVYSPGLCPSGYQGFSGYPDYVNYTSWYTTFTDHAPTLLPGEHGALCCQSGFEPQPWNGMNPSSPSCTLSIKSTLTNNPPSRFPISQTLTILSYDDWISSFVVTSTVDIEFKIHHPGIIIKWKDGDFPAGVTPATPWVSSTSTAAASGGSSQELSAGAIAGIGIGAGIGVLLILLGVIIFWRSGWRRGLEGKEEGIELREEVPRAI